MEILSMQFASALLAIILIDLVLAGDNAIVIALAARNLPKHLQTKAIVWGTVGAIVVRTSMTLIVVALLKIPGLLFAGGALLVWIAYKLLLPEDEDSAEKIQGASSFWGALRTVIVADMVMGLDNVLAVAGAAHGSFLLVTLGLLISVPIVIWGSTLLLKFVEKYPAFVYLGAGVLAWTSVKMMTSEPLAADFLATSPLVTPLLYVLVVGGVLFAGFVRNHRSLESRIASRVKRFRSAAAAASAVSNVHSGDPAMVKVLVPVDGSRNAQQAVRHVIAEFQKNPLRSPPPSRPRTVLQARRALHPEGGSRGVSPCRSGQGARAAAPDACRRASALCRARAGRPARRDDRRRGEASRVQPHRGRDRAQEFADPHGPGLGHQPAPRSHQRSRGSDRR